MTTEERQAYQEAEKLFEEYHHLAKKTLYKTFPFPKGIAKKKGLDVEDLLQYAYTGLWEACLSYNPDKGTSFKTHAINHIYWHLSNKVFRECNPMKVDMRKKYKPTELYLMESLDKTLGSEHGKVFETSTLHDIIAAETNLEETAVGLLTYKELTDKITEEEKRIIQLRLEGVSYRDIGKRYYGGCTGENVRAKLAKVRKRIQEYKRKEQVSV